MKYIFASACITNQMFRATGCGNGVMIKTVVQWALDNDIAIVSMECPETQLLGLPRKPTGKKEYLKTRINLICDDIVHKTRRQFMQFDQVDHKLIGIIGVKFSPLCCTIENSKSVYLQTGILMEKLISTFPSIPFVSATDKHKKKLLSDLNKLL